jgi:hypothetical protein
MNITETTNGILFGVEENLNILIRYAKADLQHAKENNAKSDSIDASSRLRALNAALLNIKQAYKK